MATSITLRTDGPHSPQYRAEVEDALAECVRVLNYSARAGGLETPADACALLGAWYTATSGMSQLTARVAFFLEAQAATVNRLADDSGDDPRTLVHRAARELQDAAEFAQDMTASLQEAQSCISGLHVKGENDGSE